jgi:hypothetical protein
LVLPSAALKGQDRTELLMALAAARRMNLAEVNGGVGVGPQRNPRKSASPVFSNRHGRSL